MNEDTNYRAKLHGVTRKYNLSAMYNPGGVWLYNVDLKIDIQVGGYSDKDDYESAKRQLKEQGFSDDN